MKKYWLVDIEEWGDVIIYDTFENADNWREHKEDWEGGESTIKEVTEEEALGWLAVGRYRTIMDGEGNHVANYEQLLASVNA